MDSERIPHHINKLEERFPLQRVRTVTGYLIGLLLAGCAPSYRDIAPNFPDGVGDSWNGSSAGLTYHLAGDRNTMFAVSLNAGVWRRKLGEPWKQLAKSSGLATAVDVDPNSPRHIVSSDRDNAQSESNSSSFDLSLGGVWESFDSGDTWQLGFGAILGMASIGAPAPCKNATSQAIPTVLFLPSSTILAATPCGIVRKASGAATFSWTTTQTDIVNVSALTFSRKSPRTTRIWALAMRASGGPVVLLTSTDDGQSWSINDIQTPIGGQSISFARGDSFALAAFGDTAVMVIHAAPGDGNKSILVYFDATTGIFTTQTLDHANDGTGWGGRRSFRTAFIKPPFQVGSGLRILFNAGQNVLEGNKLDSSGHINWKNRATADCGDCSDPDHIHSDLWDVLPATDNDEFWLAGDGGVYSKKGGSTKSYSDGLRTHHVHTLTLLKPRATPSGLGPSLAYATSDNDAWFWDGTSPSDPSEKWKSYKKLGDANWTEGDRGSSDLALLVRDGLNAQITNFGHSSPPHTHHVAGEPFDLSCSISFDKKGHQECGDLGVNPHNFVTFQNGPRGTETGSNLDVAWLVPLPLLSKVDGSIVELVSGSLATAIQASGSNPPAPVLIRNFALALQPSINESHFKGWFLESGSVPANATRVWASIAQGQPPTARVYYACACDSASSSPLLFKLTASSTTWSPLDVSVTSGSVTQQLQVSAPPSAGGTLEIGGPLFVNPLNPDSLMVLTTRGIAFSADGGSSWTVDEALTALVTSSGKYPMSAFDGGNGKGVAIATRGLNFMYVSAVDFGWNTDQVAVASPYTGVYFRIDSSHPWLDATPELPTPLPTVSSVALWGDEMYIGMEGRSVVQTVNLTSSRVATFFKTSPARRFVPLTLTLLGSDEAPISGESVTLTIADTNGGLSHSTLTTDVNGSVTIPSKPNGGDRVFLMFSGNSKYAPTQTAFRN